LRACVYCLDRQGFIRQARHDDDRRGWRAAPNADERIETTRVRERQIQQNGIKAFSTETYESFPQGRSGDHYEPADILGGESFLHGAHISWIVLHEQKLGYGLLG
jgi:hypothetical protein